MMRKPLAGKRAFYAMGQRAAARGQSIMRWCEISEAQKWQRWAWLAFIEGWWEVNDYLCPDDA